jgi:hypothetical protein
MKLRLILLTLSLVLPGLLQAKAEKVDDYHWTGVERVVAIGDLHGDYQQYLKVMQSAGLINNKGKWSGGNTHLVQTGDVTDRGDDSRKIIDHLVKLAKEAKKKGGYVHMLIGNHEAMNMIGDLRYVTPGEFNSYAGRNAQKLQDMQWQRQLEWMTTNDPDFETLDIDAFKAEWQTRVPLGWVEQRIAWAPDGEYGEWVDDNPVAIQINDSIFLHGGISTKYCKFSLESLTEQMHTALKNFDPSSTDTIVDDPLGPTWYRGLAQEEETEVYTQTIDNILQRYGAKRIVIGHTPTGGAVWPRFDQRVIANDTGIASYYGSHTGILEIQGDQLTAIYGDKRIPLPADNEGREDYLSAVIDLDANNDALKKRLAEMQAPESNVIVAEEQDSNDEVMLLPGTCQ